MAKGDRPWEGPGARDGGISRSASWAITGAFLLTVLMTMVVIGFSPTGLIVGSLLGVLVIIGLSALVTRSNRRKSGPPPPQLL